MSLAIDYTFSHHSDVLGGTNLIRIFVIPGYAGVSCIGLSENKSWVAFLAGSRTVKEKSMSSYLFGSILPTLLTGNAFPECAHTSLQ
jgi:hypothetical protein